MRTSISRIEKKTLYREVYDQIRSYIILNGLNPGDKLPTEQELCQMINVSRNVLREALKALQLIGVIESSPKTGMVIKEFTFDHLFENVFYSLISDETNVINELREIRSILEIAFFEEAFNTITDEDLEELYRIVESIKNKLDNDMDFLEEDKQFHFIIYRKIKNKSLLSLLNCAWMVSVDIKKAKLYVNRSLEETYMIHKAIYNAIKAKDLIEAKKQVRIHFMKPNGQVTGYMA